MFGRRTAECAAVYRRGDRACLERFVNQYLDALAAHDPSKLPLTKDARYTDNGQTLKLNDGMWAPR